MGESTTASQQLHSTSNKAGEARSNQHRGQRPYPYWASHDITEWCIMVYHLRAVSDGCSAPYRQHRPRTQYKKAAKYNK